MAVWLIFTVCFIAIVLLTRKSEEKQKKPRNSASERHNMDGKNKKANNIVPHRERSAAGSNWKLFKNTILNSSPLDENAGKERPQKKNLLHQQKPRKKSLNHKLNLQSMADAKESHEEVDEEQKKKLTKQVAMDCEMVGIGNGAESMVARVSIVNRYGYCVYDKHVKPREPVRDYRTEVSGIRPQDLQNGEEFTVVQKEVAQILKGRILIGHGLKHDLDVLYLSHPRRLLRDTSQYRAFRQLSMGRTPSLKKLAHDLLGIEIQTGEHSSVEDARAVMQVYVLYKNKWESEFYSKW